MWEPTVCQGCIYMDTLWWYFQSQTKKYSQMIIKRLLFSVEQGSPFRRPFHSYSFSKFFLPHLHPGDFTPLNVSSKKMVWSGDQAIKMFTNNIQWHQYYKWFLSLEVYKSTLGGKNDLNIYCVYSVSGTVQGLSHLVLIFDLIFTILSSTHYLSSFHSSNWGSEMLINNLPNVTWLLSSRTEIQIQVCHGLLTTTLSCHCEIIRRQHNIVL